MEPEPPKSLEQLEKEKSALREQVEQLVKDRKYLQAEAKEQEFQRIRIVINERRKTILATKHQKDLDALKTAQDYLAYQFRQCWETATAEFQEALEKQTESMMVYPIFAFFLVPHQLIFSHVRNAINEKRRNLKSL
jgi:hypothetical protein